MKYVTNLITYATALTRKFRKLYVSSIFNMAAPVTAHGLCFFRSLHFIRKYDRMGHVLVTIDIIRTLKVGQKHMDKHPAITLQVCLAFLNRVINPVNLIFNAQFLLH